MSGASGLVRTRLQATLARPATNLSSCGEGERKAGRYAPAGEMR
jgi:hypothetical protein